MDVQWLATCKLSLRQGSEAGAASLPSKLAERQAGRGTCGMPCARARRSPHTSPTQTAGPRCWVPPAGQHKVTHAEQLGSKQSQPELLHQASAT